MSEEVIIQVAGKTCRIHKDRLYSIMHEYACRYSGCNAGQKNVILTYMMDLSVIMKKHFTRKANITTEESRKDFNHQLDLKVLKALRTFRPEEGAKFNTWLTWHFRRCISDYYASLNANKTLIEFNEEVFDGKVRQNKAWVLERIKDEANRVLSVSDYRIFIAYYIHGLTFDDLAGENDMTKQGMRKKIQLMLETVVQACNRKGVSLC